MGLAAVAPVNQDIPRNPVQLPEKRDPNQTAFTDSHCTRLHRIRHSDHVIVVLVVAHIHTGTVVFRFFRNAVHHFDAENMRELAVHAAESHHMLRVTRAGQADKNAGQTTENTIKNNDDDT